MPSTLVTKVKSGSRSSRSVPAKSVSSRPAGRVAKSAAPVDSETFDRMVDRGDDRYLAHMTPMSEAEFARELERSRRKP